MGTDESQRTFDAGVRQAGAAVLMAISAHEVTRRAAAVTDAMHSVYADRIQEMARRAGNFYLERQDTPDGVSQTVGLVTEGWVVALSESLALSVGLLGVLSDTTGRPLEELIAVATRRDEG